MDDDSLLVAEPPALIAHLVERFHEAHRREFPRLVALARDLGAPCAELTAHLVAMESALDRHMFKEEMRLFPMMEQGGNRLIGLLMDELGREHRAHEEAIERLEALTAALPPAPAGATGTGTADALRAGVARLVTDLRAHVRLEDEGLFPRFGPQHVAPAADVVIVYPAGA